VKIYRVYDTRDSKYVGGVSRLCGFYMSPEAAKMYVTLNGLPYKDQDRYVIHSFSVTRDLEEVK